MSFSGQSFLSLMKVSLFFKIIDHAFDDLKSSPNPTSPRFSLILSSRSFKVFHFMFRSTIHSELVFVKGVRSAPHADLRFSFLWMSDWSSAVCWQDHLCSILLPLPLDWRSMTIFVEPICVLYSIPLTYLSFLSPIRHCLDS